MSSSESVVAAAAPVSILRGHRSGVTALLFGHIGCSYSSSSSSDTPGDDESSSYYFSPPSSSSSSSSSTSISRKDLSIEVGSKLTSLRDLYREEEEEFASSSSGRKHHRVNKHYHDNDDDNDYGDGDYEEDSKKSTKNASLNVSTAIPPRIVSGSQSGELRVWDLSSRRPLVSLQGHNDSILSIQNTRSGDLLSSSRDGTMRLWDVSTMSMPLPSSSNSSFPDASGSFSGNSSSSATLLASNNGLKGTYVTGAQGFARSSYDAPSDIIASASVDEYEVLIWDVRQKTPVQSVNLQNSNSNNCSNYGDGKGSSSQSTTKGRDSTTGNGFGMVTQMAFDVSPSNSSSTNGSRGPISNLYIGFENGSLAVIDCRKFLPILTSSLHENSITAIYPTTRRVKSDEVVGGANSFENVVVTGAADSNLHISMVAPEDSPLNTTTTTASTTDDVYVKQAFVSSTTASTIGVGHLSSIFGTKSTTSVLGASSLKVGAESTKSHILQRLHTINLPKVGNVGTSDVCVRPDSKILVSSHWDKTIRVFQFKKTMKPLALLNFHRENVSCLAFCEGASNGATRRRSGGSYHHYFASGSSDCTIAVWDLYANT